MSEPEKRVFKDHFSGVAPAYAEYRPRYPAELSEFLARTAPRRALAWDCGCGSGQFSEDLARHFEKVLATDASAEQIAQARPHPRIEYRCASAESSGLGDRSADLIAAAQAAHWFDLSAWYAEVRRVAARGAVVAIAGYGTVVIGDGLDDVIARFYSGILGPYWPLERQIVEDGYRDLPFPFETIESPCLEMFARWTLDEFLGYVGTWSATRAMLRARGPGPFGAFRTELAHAWGAREAQRELRWPLALRVGRV